MTNRVLSLATLLVVISGSLATADVVALKRSAGLTDFRGLDAGLAAALEGGAATVYSGQGVVADATLYSDQGWAQSQIYANSGAVSQVPSYAPILLKLGLDVLPGFAGGTVTKAELRFYTPAGNGGMNHTGYITFSDWSEGNKTDAMSGFGNYPGLEPAAPGVTGAYPSALNTGPYQTADGTPVDVGWPPDMSKAPFGWANNQPFGFDKDAVGVVSGVVRNPWGVTPGQWDQYLTIDVTPILQLWADGTPNYGLVVDNVGNYTPYLSEYAGNPDWQPVLVMDYTPVPEPISLALVLGGLGLIGRRMRRD